MHWSWTFLQDHVICLKLAVILVSGLQQLKRASNVQRISVFARDVTKEEDAKRLMDYIETESDSGPRSLCSKLWHFFEAREIKVPGLPIERRPQPLRSDEHPDGLPHLSGTDQKRVNAANDSYSAMVTLILFLIAFGIGVSIENPRNSILWLCSMMTRLFDRFLGHDTFFDHCIHGGTRDKSTRWWNYNPRVPQVNLFASLGLQCDKQHQHASWKPIRQGKRVQFPTAEEAKYPFILCQRVAFILKQEAAARGFRFPEDLQQQVQVDDNVGKRQLFASQPRSRKLKPLVSEFMGYNTLVCNVSDSTALPTFLDKMPKGARVCHRQVEWGFCRADANERFSSFECASDWEDNTVCEIIHVGIPRAPEDFLREAVSKGHPRNLIARVPEAVQEAIENLLHQPLHLRLAKRTQFFKKWLKRSLELRSQEEELREQMPLHLKRVLKGKRLLLWKEILVDLKYKDAGIIIDDVIKGFSLTGWAPKTGVFEPWVRKPEYSLIC
jgi:hypothetical protein